MSEPLDKIVNQAREALGDNLQSIVLYGSHARSDAGPHSDYNLLIVVKDYTPGRLAPLRAHAQAWLKLRVVPPVIMQADQMPRSLDTFALEFLEMAAARTVLFGGDPFADFAPDWNTVRSELEREARQKRISLVRRWLAAGGDAKIIKALIADTVPSYFTLLRCTLMLKRREVLSLTTDAVFAELSGKPWFKPDIWSRLRAVVTGQAKLSKAELEALIPEYIQQAMALVHRLDELE